jgi:hypothetical protein
MTKQKILTITFSLALSFTSAIFTSCVGREEPGHDDNKQNTGQSGTTNPTNPDDIVTKFYTFCYDEGVKEVAEIDIETGKLIWTNWKMPNYPIESKGCLYDDKRNEFIVFGYEDAETLSITRLNLSTQNETKKTINVVLNDFDLFSGFIKHKDKFYSFCNNDNKKELAEIDVETGNFIWTGYKIPDYPEEGRGLEFDDKRNEFIVFGYDNYEESILSIRRLNLSTKNVITKTLSNLNGAHHFSDIIKCDDKYYTFCNDDNKKELAEIDIETGNLIWTGIKILDYPIESNGYIFDKSRNEIVSFVGYGDFTAPTIYRLNLSTKNLEQKPLENMNGRSHFKDIIVINR